MTTLFPSELFELIKNNKELTGSCNEIQYIFNILDYKKNEIQKLITSGEIEIFKLRLNLDDFFLNAQRIKNYIINAKSRFKLNDNEYYLNEKSNEWEEIRVLHNLCEHEELFELSYPPEYEICQKRDVTGEREACSVFLIKKDKNKEDIIVLCNRLKEYIKKEINTFVQSVLNKFNKFL